MEAFLQKEEALRKKSAQMAAETGQIATMKPTGTKKRRTKAAESGGAKKRRRKGGEEGGTKPEKAQSGGSDTDESELDLFGSPKRSPSTPITSPAGIEEPKPRPRPRPRPRRLTEPASSDGALDQDPSPDDGGLDGTEKIDMPKSLSLRDPSARASGDELDDAPPFTGRGKKGRLHLVLSDEDE